jgi:hypothetical protein
MSNITALLDTTWFFGLPFDNATNTTGISQIVATVEEILGSSLLALQLGNEPDLSEPFPFVGIHVSDISLIQFYSYTS